MRKSSFRLILASLALAALCGCSPAQQASLNAAASSPSGKTFSNAVALGGAAAAVEAINEYDATGKVDQKKVEAAAAKAAILSAVSGS